MSVFVTVWRGLVGVVGMSVWSVGGCAYHDGFGGGNGGGWGFNGETRAGTRGTRDAVLVEIRW